MKFGLIFEIPVPRPWHPHSMTQAFDEALEQIRLADRMGFHSVWTVEHHFLDEYSASSAPGVFYGAIAAQTSNIRIGHGVRLLPFPYNHPVRAAEAAATVDILSGGRLEFGTGRSGTRTELEGFGIEPSQTREMWEEALDLIVECWTKDVVDWHGKHFTVPGRGVMPKPVQQPHPPIWGASSSSESHELVGERGLGLLSFNIAAAPETLENRFGRYRKGIEKARADGRPIHERIGTFTQAHCAKTNEEAFARARDPFAWYVQKSLHAVAELGDWKDGTNMGTYEYAQKILGGVDIDTLDFDYLVGNDAVMVGDPDRCIEMAKRFEAMGTDLLLCLVQPYNIPHTDVLESIELLGRHVLPEFD